MIKKVSNTPILSIADLLAGIIIAGYIASVTYKEKGPELLALASEEKGFLYFVLVLIIGFYAYQNRIGGDTARLMLMIVFSVIILDSAPKIVDFIQKAITQIQES